MNQICYDRICDFLESKREEMTAVLASVVTMESFTEAPKDVERVAKEFRRLFESEGLQCELVEAAPNGPTLLGVLGGERAGKPVVFSGHMDTVIKPGTYQQPVFRVEDGKAYGPGVLDMKGGIVIALYIIKALNAVGYVDRPLKIAFSGDEESGHSGSNGAELLKNAAADAICAFNMETGLIDNSLCYGRKGRVGATITVHGKEAHAGNDFQSGINAIEEMSQKILRLQELTDLTQGTTVTCATIEGGTVNNAIPGHCTMQVECRFEKGEEMLRFRSQLERICRTAYVPGSTAALQYTDAFDSFECTPGTMRLWQFIKDTAQQVGLEEVHGIMLGGASDAAYIQKSGTPVVCSMGIRGQWNHTTKEYAVLDSMVSRGKLISAVLLKLDQF